MRQPPFRLVRGSILLALLAFSAPSNVFAQRGAPAGIQKTKEDVLIAMRDGIELAADLYIPTGTGPFPTLLTITPYGKNATSRTAASYVASGYAVVAVDSRGLRSSKGKWEPYVHEARDGYDVQTWVAK